MHDTDFTFSSACARPLCSCVCWLGRPVWEQTLQFNFSFTPPAAFPCFYIYIEEEECEPQARRIRILSNQCVTSFWQSFFSPIQKTCSFFSCQQKVICCIVIRPNSWVMEVHEWVRTQTPTVPRTRVLGGLLGSSGGTPPRAASPSEAVKCDKHGVWRRGLWLIKDGAAPSSQGDVLSEPTRPVRAQTLHTMPLAPAQ